MAYIEFEDSPQGQADRKAFWHGPDGLQLIRQWRREGASFERIAFHIGVSERTLSKWRSQDPDMEAAINQTDQLVNAMVENALLRRALGYDKVDVVEELVEGEMREIRRTTTPVPPDVKACLSWLYSRRSDRWRAQQEPIDATAEEVAQAKEILVTIARAAGEAVARSDG